MPAKSVPKPQDPIQQLEKDLLSDVPGALADLYRVSGGFSVGMILLPELEKPTEAHFTVCTIDGDKHTAIDTFTVPVKDSSKNSNDAMDKAMDAFHHTTLYSEPLLVFLCPTKKKKETDEKEK